MAKPRIRASQARMDLEVNGRDVTEIGGRSRVARNIRSRIINFIFYPVVFIATAAVLPFLFGVVAEEVRMANDGVAAIATVTDRRVNVEDEVEFGETVQRETFFITVEYPAPDGTTLTRERGVSAEEYGQLLEGMQIQVVYIPSEPDNIRIGNADPRVALLLFVVIGIVCVGAGLMTVWNVLGLVGNVRASGATSDPRGYVDRKREELGDAVRETKREFTQMPEEAKRYNELEKAARDRRIQESGLPQWAYVTTMGARAWTSLGVWLLVGLAVHVAAFFFTTTYLETRSILTQGVPTTATVLSQRTQQSEGSSNASHFVTYEYDGDPGEGVMLYQFEENVTEGFYNQVGVGSAFEVRYLPEDPSQVRAVSGTRTVTMLLAIVFSGVFAVVSWFMLLGSLVAFAMFGKTANSKRKNAAAAA